MEEWSDTFSRTLGFHGMEEKLPHHGKIPLRLWPDHKRQLGTASEEAAVGDIQELEIIRV